MKLKLILALLIISQLVVFCSKNDSNSLEWIQGKWIRENDKEEHITYENWIKKSNLEYTGESFTLHKKDTTFSEKMRLIKINKVWNLEITGVHDEPIFFNFISQTKNSFVCENKENEFPKKIRYSIEKEILTAKISNDTLEIPFIFKKY
jgi:hypothetical protein